MAIDVSKLGPAMADLKTAAVKAQASLDDLAAKIAAIPAQDPAAQAVIDAAVADAGAIKDGLNVTADKDDPAPVAPAA